ncbi:MAG: hypothetical protein WBB67_12080 [bacterium]
MSFLEKFLLFRPPGQGNLAVDVFREKVRFQKATLVQTVKLISEREKSKQRNIAALVSEIMGLQSQLYVYQCHWYPIAPDNKRKGTLERAISELKDKKRQEEIDCWKDTLELWQNLLKIAAEYRAIVRKAQVLLPGE